MSITIQISEDTEPSEEMISNTEHSLRAWFLDKVTVQDVYLDFSTRLAMYEFGKSLITEALYGQSGQQERNPQDGQVVNSVRLTSQSARLYVNYEHSSPIPVL